MNEYAGFCIYQFENVLQHVHAQQLVNQCVFQVTKIFF
jgi:hypothetical protein